MKIQIETKIPTERDFRKLNWTVREAKKFEMVEAAKMSLILHSLPDEPRGLVAIEIGASTTPEHLHVEPIITVLRRLGWISQDCSIVLRTTDAHGLVEITL